MNYRFLSQRGWNYTFEEGTSGERSAALQQLETNLKNAMTDLKNALKQPVGAPVTVAPKKTTSAVSKLIADHETAQKRTVTNGNVAELEAKVKQLRDWLKLQNCVVKLDGSIDAAKSARVVVYDHSLATQDMTQVGVVGGQLFLVDAAGTQPLDTTRMVTHKSGPGHAIYVMSAEGNLHVSNHSVGHRHHSSLLAGSDVAGAGELKATNGRLLWLSNKSGHYCPSAVHLLQTLHQIQKLGVPMTFALTSYPGETYYPTVGAFLRKLEMDEEPDYELNKLFAYAAHLTDATLGTHTPDPWRWRDLSQFPDEVPGVHTVATNTFVPHKTVRQWLKSRGLTAPTDLQLGVGR